jgi:hypothetical protein
MVARKLGPKQLLNIQMHNDRRVRTGSGKVGAGIFGTIGKILGPVARDVVLPALAKLAVGKIQKLTGGGVIVTNRRLPPHVALKLLGNMTPAQLTLLSKKSKVGGGIFTDIAKLVGPGLIDQVAIPALKGLSGKLAGKGLKRAGRNPPRKPRGSGLVRAGRNRPPPRGSGPGRRKKRRPAATFKIF